VDQLYVVPGHTGEGIRSRLIVVAKQRATRRARGGFREPESYLGATTQAKGVRTWDEQLVTSMNVGRIRRFVTATTRRRARWPGSEFHLPPQFDLPYGLHRQPRNLASMRGRRHVRPPL